MLREFSPVYYLSQSNKDGPPIFIARADLADAGLNAGMDRFVQVALSRNLTPDLANHPTDHHGFDVEDNNARSREIIKRTIEFIKSHSKRPDSRSRRGDEKHSSPSWACWESNSALSLELDAFAQVTRYYPKVLTDSNQVVWPAF